MHHFARIVIVIYPQHRLSISKLTTIAERSFIIICLVMVVMCAVIVHLDVLILPSGHFCHSFTLVEPQMYIILSCLSTVLLSTLACTAFIIYLVMSTKTASGRTFYTKIERHLFYKMMMTLLALYIEWLYIHIMVVVSNSKPVTMIYYIAMVAVVFSVNPMCNGVLNYFI